MVSIQPADISGSIFLTSFELVIYIIKKQFYLIDILCWILVFEATFVFYDLAYKKVLNYYLSYNIIWKVNVPLYAEILLNSYNVRIKCFKVDRLLKMKISTTFFLKQHGLGPTADCIS